MIPANMCRTFGSWFSLLLVPSWCCFGLCAVVFMLTTFDIPLLDPPLFRPTLIVFQLVSFTTFFDLGFAALVFDFPSIYMLLGCGFTCKVVIGCPLQLEG
jgi:hypothetical protein